MIDIEWNHLRDVLNRYGDYFIKKAQENLLVGGNNVSGELTNSMEKIVLIDKEKFSVRISVNDYWKYVNYGTKPHYPPIAALKKWVEIKHIKPQTRNGKTPSVEQLPYMIQKSIGKYGTKGTHFWDDAYNDTYEYFDEAIALAIEEDIADAITKIVEQFATTLGG